MVIAKSVRQRQISSERHAIIGPQVCAPSTNSRIVILIPLLKVLRSIFARVDLPKFKRYNERKVRPLGNTHYEFLGLRNAGAFSQLSNDTKLDVTDLNSGEVSELIGRGLKLWDQQEGDDDSQTTETEIDDLDDDLIGSPIIGLDEGASGSSGGPLASQPATRMGEEDVVQSMLM
jgi:hypothetical protein